MAFGAWILALGGMAIGLPSPGVGFEFLSGLVGGARGDTRISSAAIETTQSAENLMKFRREIFDGRPTPKPSPSEAESGEIAEETVEAAPSYGGSITDIIYAAAAEYGIDGAYMVSIATCESGLNPSAYNAAGYHGLFQYDDTTWAAYGYGSIYDPVAQARTTAELLAAGQSSRWPNCA